MKTSEQLNLAADLIEEYGEGSGTASMMGESGLCIMGALHLSVFGKLDEFGYPDAARCPAGRAVWNYLDLDAEDDDAGWTWNDTVADAGDSVRVLRAVALIEAAREQSLSEADSYAFAVSLGGAIARGGRPQLALPATTGAPQ